jgi:hypothetical protein
MARQVGAWLVGDDWNAILEDVQQFLEKWYFSLSAGGVMYIRPHGRVLTMRDVDVLLRRLQVITDREFPSVLILDFAGMAAAADDWRTLKGKLLNHARETGSRIVGGANAERAPDCVLMDQAENPLDDSMAIAAMQQWFPPGPSAVVLLKD